MTGWYYVPEVGRFASPDTLVPDPSNPQSYNRYSYVLNSPTKYVDPSGHDAECWAFDSAEGRHYSCDEWMLEAMTILGLEGGADGLRLSWLFLSWLNDPNKMLRIYAMGRDNNSMNTRRLLEDFATINIGRDVVSQFDRGDIALLGHELEHVSQGTWQAWSIQGEVLAYQVEFRIREAFGIGQTPNTQGSMAHPRFSLNSYADLQRARTGFLGDPWEPYDVWYEPNLPWPQEITYQAALHQAKYALTPDPLPPAR